jgi:hypothetical protein
MNPTTFDNLLMEFTLLDYTTFWDRLNDRISIDLFSEEQQKTFLELIQIRQLEGKNYTAVRTAAMTEIMDMSFEKFTTLLKHNALPEFHLATPHDSDWCNVLRDSNHTAGFERAYQHRNQLSQVTRHTFMINHLIHHKEFDLYYRRIENMEVIMNMTFNEFSEALKNDDNILKFNRSKFGDPDYVFILKQISGEDGYDLAYWNRRMLRIMEIDDFKFWCNF